jgi:putative tryptophan/tyrosine transport system substrate-binding protein
LASSARPGFRDFAERWNVDSGSASLHLDVEGPDDVAPLLGFVGDELAEVGGGSGKNRTARDDPVKLGLVSSLARPGGNFTGVNFFGSEVVSKRLELLRELVPRLGRLAVLVNPSNAPISESIVREVEAAARGMGVQVQVFNAGTSREIDAAFANLVRERSDAVFVTGDAFLISRRVQLATLAARYMVPSSFSQREVTEVGGLMSYAANVRDTYRQVGVYVGRILKGAKPADLPVVQPSNFELVINAQTARMLSLTVPASLLAIADEVIE